jgi:hypothetical protein
VFNNLFFSEIHAVYELMSKNAVEPHRTDNNITRHLSVAQVQYQRLLSLLRNISLSGSYSLLSNILMMQTLVFLYVLYAVTSVATALQTSYECNKRWEDVVGRDRGKEERNI